MPVSPDGHPYANGHDAAGQLVRVYAPLATEPPVWLQPAADAHTRVCPDCLEAYLSTDETPHPCGPYKAR